MVRLGGIAHPPYIAVFEGIRKHFLRHDIELEWLMYRNWDALVDGFVNGEVDLAWNGPLAYVKIQDRLATPCQVVAMRDTDVDFATCFITHAQSNITTVEDLIGSSFAFGSRGSVQAGLLAHYFLKQNGINPRTDLKLCTFYEEREASPTASVGSDENDVIQRVLSQEYAAGAVSNRTLEQVLASGDKQEVRAFWTSPGYSHCCFTAQSGMSPELSRKITDALVSISADDPEGKAVLDGEHCSYLIPGTNEGWEFLDSAAREEGLI